MGCRVSVVTTAYNRLEYTIRCINSVRHLSGLEDYEHIVVSQGSTDGTVQWLDWIHQMPSKWYPRVRAVHNGSNSGPWGGMKAGVEQAGGEFIIQMENDIEVLSPNWGNLLVSVFEQATRISREIITVSLKREGVGTRLKGRHFADIAVSGQSYRVIYVDCSVACFIMSRQRFDAVKDKVPNCEGLRRFGKPLKITTVPCYQIEGYELDGIKGSYVQHDKYGLSEKR